MLEKLQSLSCYSAPNDFTSLRRHDPHQTEFHIFVSKICLALLPIHRGHLTNYLNLPQDLKASSCSELRTFSSCDPQTLYRRHRKIMILFSQFFSTLSSGFHPTSTHIVPSCVFWTKFPSLRMYLWGKVFLMISLLSGITQRFCSCFLTCRSLSKAARFAWVFSTFQFGQAGEDFAICYVEYRQLELSFQDSRPGWLKFRSKFRLPNSFAWVTSLALCCCMSFVRILHNRLRSRSTWYDGNCRIFLPWMNSGLVDSVADPGPDFIIRRNLVKFDCADLSRNAP